MKKFLKITAISLFLIAFTLVTTELVLMYKFTNTNFFNKGYIHKNEFRNPAIYKNSTKKSIILMGCSFFQDSFLAEDKIAHSLISKMTKRNVYNLAIEGSTPVEALYILKDLAPNFKLKELLNNDTNIGHVIYAYIPLHTDFIKTCARYSCPIFKINKKEKELSLKRNPLYSTIIYQEFNFFIFQSYRFIFSKLFFLKRMQKLFDVLTLHVFEMQKEIKKNFGEDTKFTVLVVKEGGYENWEELKQQGINVIKLNEITDVNIDTREYAISDTNNHPNEKAWEVIVPALIKELDL